METTGITTIQGNDLQAGDVLVGFWGAGRFDTAQPIRSFRPFTDATKAMFDSDGRFAEGDNGWSISIHDTARLIVIR